MTAAQPSPPDRHCELFAIRSRRFVVNLLSRATNQAEAIIRESCRRIAEASVSRHQPRTAISIITAAQNTAVAKFGTAIINFDLRIDLSVPVKAPFVNVTLNSSVGLSADAAFAA